MEDKFLYISNSVSTPICCMIPQFYQTFHIKYFNEKFSNEEMFRLFNEICDVYSLTELKNKSSNSRSLNNGNLVSNPRDLEDSLDYGYLIIKTNKRSFCGIIYGKGYSVYYSPTIEKQEKYKLVIPIKDIPLYYPNPKFSLSFIYKHINF